VPTDYYELLGVKRDATDADIKKAFRSLAMKYHPDRNQGDKDAESKFREINSAYQVLSDPEKRSQYDRFGKTFDDASSGFGGFNSSSIFEDLFGDAFGSMFGGRSGGNPNKPRKGGNISVNKVISFEESIFGTETEISAPQMHTCETCSGSGAAPGGIDTCAACHGSGMRTVRQGPFTMQTTCHVCGGIGKLIKDKCGDCSGAGYTQKNKKLNIKIPAGIEDAMAIRATGEGHCGANGGRSGDLIVNVSVMPHKYYRREENNLILEVPVTFLDAVLGKEIKIPMLDRSEEKVQIKAGTQFGDVITIRGKGAPDVHGRGKGNLIIILQIMLPTHLNEKQKKAFENIAEVTDDNMYNKNKSLWQKMKSLFK
jgi:molecular chaperone DnaJ